MIRSHRVLCTSIVVAAFLCHGCADGGRLGGLRQNSPAEVIQACFMAANEGRYSDIDRYLSREALKALEFKGVMLGAGKKGRWDWRTRNGMVEKIEILKEEVRGEGAKVKFKIHFKDGATRDDEEELIKEAGVWKIA